jgi:hypothetical protein
VKCGAEQLDYVYAAAAVLEPQERESFLRSVASRLEGEPAPTPKQVRRAVCFILEARHGIAVGRHALVALEMHPAKRKGR